MTIEKKLTHRLGQFLVLPQVLPLAISLFVSLSLINTCSASVTASHSDGLKKSVLKKSGVKRIASKHKNLVKPAMVLTAAVADVGQAPSPVAVPADLAAKATQAIAVQPDAPLTASTAAASPSVNPYLANQQQVEPVTSGNGAQPVFSGLKLSMPRIPLFEQAILPKIQTVYPTGEKPLVVVTFKCPTELVGIDTPSTLILHKAVNGGMDLINRSNLLAFNMQQVCQ